MDLTHSRFQALGILGGEPVRSRKSFTSEAPQINEDDIQCVLATLRERKLSIFSSTKIVEFEEAFARFTGTAFAVAVTSGTAALQASLSAIRIGPGDEV